MTYPKTLLKQLLDSAFENGDITEAQYNKADEFLNPPSIDKITTRVENCLFRHLEYKSWDHFHKDVQNGDIWTEKLINKTPNFGKTSLKRLREIYKEKYNSTIPNSQEAFERYRAYVERSRTNDT